MIRTRSSMRQNVHKNRADNKIRSQLYYTEVEGLGGHSASVLMAHLHQGHPDLGWIGNTGIL